MSLNDVRQVKNEIKTLNATNTIINTIIIAAANRL